MSIRFKAPLCVLLVGVLAACSRPELDTSEIIRPVRVTEISTADARMQESYPAQIEPRFSSPLSFQVGGQLRSRKAEIGQIVQAGEVLAQLDPKDLRLALKAAQAQLSAAKTESQQLKTDLQRSEKLRAQGFISQAQLDRQQLAYDAARSRLTQAQANYNAKSNQSRYGELRAPNAGVITALFAEEGQVMAPGQPVMQWANQDAVQVKLAVPETRVQQFRSGMSAEVKLWASDTLLPAQVREVSPVADPVTRTYEVLLDLQKRSELARFGMSATVYFDKSLGDTRPLLPASAVVADGLGAFVWVFDETEGTVSKRRIAATEVIKEGVLIDKGLEDGDLVVTAGTHILNEGQRVKRYVEPEEIEEKLAEARRQAQPE